MIEHYFQQGGKLYRPTVALTMAACCVDIKYNQMELINENQHKIAVIAEMIHTASLVHDDIIDEANIRRASPTVNAIWGNKMVWNIINCTESSMISGSTCW
jgi:decaprenyl-diphosphate synthase subunit 1